MQGIAVTMINADHRNAITELHQAFGSCLMVIADGDVTAPEGVTMRKNETHCVNSHPFSLGTDRKLISRLSVLLSGFILA